MDERTFQLSGLDSHRSSDHNNLVKKDNFFICFVIGCLLVLPSVEAAPLKLKDVYEAALNYSLERQIERENVALNEERYSQAKGAVMPTVSLRARHFRQDRIQGQNFADNQQTSTFLNISQPLFQGLREYTALGIARENVTRAEKVVESYERQLLFEVARVYYSLLIDQRELVNTRELMKLTKQRVDDLRARVEIGRSRTSELILAQSQLVTVESREQSLERNLAILWTDFELLTGLTTRPQLEAPTGEISLDTLGAYLAKMDNLPELQRARLDVELADRQVELAHRFHYPDLVFEGNYYVQRNGVQGEREWDMSLNLQFPLFEGFRVQSRTREAALQRRQSVLQLNQLERTLQAEIKELHGTLEVDLNRVTVTERAVSLARRNYEEQRREYNLGLVTNQEVLQALNAYIENQQSYDRLKLESAYNAVILKAKVGDAW